jgi:mono/diheme cytochrome c family protein
MQRFLSGACLLIVVGLVSITAAEPTAAQPADADLARRFTTDVLPVLKTNCLSCHGTDRQEAKLDLSGFRTDADVVKNYRIWETVAERLEAEEMPPEEMPPEKAARQPTANQRQAVVSWIRELGDREAARNAGDPGPVLARRLSNAEYNRSIRDLTGVDIQPTREFPVDPANEAGFDNTGESLTMSPALLKKYLEAARLVADHVVLKPEGFAFAPYPVVAETDRDHYCVHRIVDFYKRHQVDYADYFHAAWQFEHRAALGQPHATLEEMAVARRLSPGYLTTVWKTLSDPAPRTGPLAQVVTTWRALSPEKAQAATVRTDCEKLRDDVLKLRQGLVTPSPKIHVEGISDGSQPFVLWANRQLAASRTKYLGKEPDNGDLALFCRIFPYMFVVYDRAPYFDQKAAGSGRFLTAGFHLMQGHFRDDAPLRDLVLNEAERSEIDALWRELDFVTLALLRQYKDFIFFERAEPPRYMVEARFDFARAEDKDSVTPAKIDRLHQEYRDKAAAIGANDRALEAIDEYFSNISKEIRWVEQTRTAAEPSHLTALADFATRAYRRPLSADERRELVDFYKHLREQDGLTHEEAIRDSLASVLLSPHFSYRFDLAATGPQPESLSPFDLASRLSYFLWSSLPDAELLARAEAGDLAQTAVLTAQTRRMLRDPKIRGLAEEFAGNWLDIRRFEEYNAVDRERFPSFTNDLREAMYEEPIRFFCDVARENRPITDLLYGNHTFVNPLLAKHYGINLPETAAGDWVRVDDAERYGRGGLLTMAVFLTRNAPGLRTSPVKRGYWVVRRLLGEHIPPPPPEVPELPKDEAALGELSLPQLLARHREHKACAGCHQRFDSIGLAFEGFGPIGERRQQDLGGKPITNTASFPDGSEGTGPDGLRKYLHARREGEFVDNLCRKLLSYALGRSLLPSDKGLLENMKQSLAANDNRFGSLIETIVTSKQFLNKRGTTE